MRWRCIHAVLAAGLAAAVGAAQDQSGRIEGTVVDAVTHQPVKKAAVSLQPIGRGPVNRASAGAPNAGEPNTITDALGGFVFENLAVGKYRISVTQQNYPESLMRGTRQTVEVSADDATGSVTIELMPGAAISGHIVDEDGDPMTGCFVQAHSADMRRFAPVMRPPAMRDDGTYRLSGIAAGKYIISAQCSETVFQPRPLSAGPDPPPTQAYPMQYYSAASDAKSAQVVQLAAGAEKSGVDFQMHPVAVTHIHGTFAAGGADGRGRGDLNVLLVPVDANNSDGFAFRGRGEVNEDGTFDIHQVFPGSYYLAATSVRDPRFGMLGGVMRVDVTDGPLNVSLALHPAMDISGKVEIEDNAHRVTPAQINLQLDPVIQYGAQPAFAQVAEDGSFTFKSVLPGEWRIRLFAPGAFLKSARMGGDDVTNQPLNLMPGAAGILELVASTNTATVAGTAPVGRLVFAQAEGAAGLGQGYQVAQVDANGQFKMGGLAPGKYRFAVGDDGAPMPDQGGQEVTVEAGETQTVELKGKRMQNSEFRIQKPESGMKWAGRDFRRLGTSKGSEAKSPRAILDRLVPQAAETASCGRARAGLALYVMRERGATPLTKVFARGAVEDTLQK